MAELTVPGLADWCAVLMPGEGDALEPIAVAGPSDLSVADEVLRAGETRLEGGVIAVPLAIAGQRPIGALWLGMATSGRAFDEADLALARELGHRAATAVENARLYAERSLIATTLQRSLLPPELPEIPGFRLAGFYQAAGEQNDVGGDFYDAFEVPG